MVNDAEVRKLLENRLLELSPPLPVSFENSDDDGGQNRLETQLFRSGNIRFGLGHEHNHIGFFQITVVTRVGTGSIPPDRVAVSVQQLYPSGLKLHSAGTTVKITQTPEIARGDPGEGSEWRVPVTVYFEARD